MKRALRFAAFPVALLLAGIVEAETYTIDANAG
jgi:hypothetical protein